MPGGTPDKRILAVIVAGVCALTGAGIWAFAQGTPAATRNDDKTPNATVVDRKAPADEQGANDKEAEPSDDEGATTDDGTLVELDVEQRKELWAAVRAWMERRGIDPDTTTEVVGSPTRTSVGISIYLHIPSLDTYLVAQRSDAGSWSVTRLLQTVPGVNDTATPGAQPSTGNGVLDSTDAYAGMALVSQVEALARYLPDDCAASLTGDMEAAGVKTAGAWVDVTSVSDTGDATSFDVFVPIYFAGGEGTEVWRATWRAGQGSTFELVSRDAG